MKFCRRFLCFLGALLLLASTARAVVERVLDQSFPLSTGRASVQVDAFVGEIKVAAGDTQNIRVQIRQTVTTDDSAVAEAAIAGIEFKLEQGSDGRVSVRIEPRHRMRWTWQNWSPVALMLEITVPHACDLQLRTGDGAIQVDRLRGDIVAETDRGAIFLGEIQGDVVADSLRGDVSVTACNGTLQLEAKSGNILVGRSWGPAQLLAVDGVIDLQAATGPVFARGDRADIKVNFLPSGRTASNLESSGGDVTVGFDPACTFTIDARSSPFGFVRIRDLELKTASGNVEKTRVTGMLNGGGPVLKIRAGGGSVRLNRVPSL
jgi:hypothetical protein